MRESINVDECFVWLSAAFPSANDNRCYCMNAAGRNAVARARFVIFVCVQTSPPLLALGFKYILPRCQKGTQICEHWNEHVSSVRIPIITSQLIKFIYDEWHDQRDKGREQERFRRVFRVPCRGKIGYGCCLLLVPVRQTTTPYVECGYVRGVGNVYFALHDMHTII